MNKIKLHRRNLILASGGLLALLLSQGITAHASGASTPSGCAFQPIDIDKYGGKPFKNPEVVRFDGNDENATLEVKYAERKLAGCETRLRSYNGLKVGPTFRLKPGDTMNVLLKNDLPPEVDTPPHDHNTPHGFNITNLHTHGLHVSPSGNSDNVLLRVEPQTQFQYEIKVPEDHPPGTFWYHAHVHGSTALQVSSGMGGMLIIEGGLDTVPEIAAAKDQSLVFQQIAYDEQGEIENYDNFGPGAWGRTQRQTTINGDLVPEITLRPGEVQRWRLLHAGVRETIMAGLDGHDLYEIALDGLALGKMNKWDAVELQPGYRVDVLVKAKPLPKGVKERVYYLRDKEMTSGVSLKAEYEPERILAKIVVKGKPVDMALPDCTPNMPCEVLAKFKPHEDIKDEELTGEPQRVFFDIDHRVCPDDPSQPCVPCTSLDQAGCEERFMVNDIPFHPSNVRQLVLGTASEWTLNSGLVNHPFHIHVNPFQVMRKGPDGKDELVWRDTILIRENVESKLRSRYVRYTGKFVFHCHILDHEDRGMMETVEVVMPAAE